MSAAHHELHYLLDLDGEVMVLDREANYWAKFRVKLVEVTADRPHGIKYSLTLHTKQNQRIAGIDNAHEVTIGSGPGRKRTSTTDHLHRFTVITPYTFKDAGTLIQDFWQLVDSVIRELEAAQ
jgi:Family of unknown function (DUF6516)